MERLHLQKVEIAPLINRRLIYGVAECVTVDGRLLTHHTWTYIRRDD